MGAAVQPPAIRPLQEQQAKQERLLLFFNRYNYHNVVPSTEQVVSQFQAHSQINRTFPWTLAYWGGGRWERGFFVSPWEFIYDDIRSSKINSRYTTSKMKSQERRSRMKRKVRRRGSVGNRECFIIRMIRKETCSRQIITFQSDLRPTPSNISIAGATHREVKTTKD